MNYVLVFLFEGVGMLFIKTDEWYIERVIYLFAGIFTLVSTALAFFHSIYWLIFTAFVGINLVIFALTGFCLMANILYKLGLKTRLNR